MRNRPAYVNTCYLATLAIRILDLYDSSSNAFWNWIRIVNNTIPDRPVNYSGSYTCTDNPISGKGVLENDSKAVYYNKECRESCP
jgi:hypothetical protein